MGRHSDDDIVTLLQFAFACGVFLVWIASVFFGGCDVSQEQAVEILEPQGFTDVQATGYEFFVCGGDSFSAVFEATSPTGERVNGVVCCGIAKSCTVRW